MKSVLLTLLISASTMVAIAQTQVTIRYIGNMGVLISGEESSILIDGLHDRYVSDAYLYPAKSTLEELIANNGSTFPKIKAALNTHFHQDHFDEMLTKQFLAVNKQSVFIGSAQAIDELSAAEGEMFTFSTDGYQKQTINYGDFTITGFYLNHVNPNRNSTIQNVGYIIAIQGVRILHTGDTNWFEEAFESLNLINEKIDVALLPYWMILEEESVDKMARWIAPNQVVALHLYPKNYQGHERSIRANFPNAKLMLNANDTITIQATDN